MLLDPRQVDGLPSLRDSIRVAKPVVAKDLPFRRNRNFQVPGGSGSRNRRVRRRGRRGCSWGRCWGSGFGRRRSRRRRTGVTVTIQGSPFTAAVRCEPSVRLRDLNDGTLSAAGGNRLLRRAAKTAEPLPGALGAAWSGVKSWRNFCADQPGPIRDCGQWALGRWGVAVGWGVRVFWCAVAKPGKTAARMRMGAANAIASEILLCMACPPQRLDMGRCERASVLSRKGRRGDDLPPVFAPPVMCVQQARGQGRQARGRQAPASLC